MERSHESNESVTSESKIKMYEKHLREVETEAKNYQVHYRRSLFQLGVSLAHECFHVLTGRWTGIHEIGTPYKQGEIYKDKRDDEIEEKRHGEAGFQWEYQYGFNGSINLAWGKNDKKKGDPYPLKDDELAAGVSFVRKLSSKPDGTPEVTWARIAHAYIQDVTTQGRSIHTPQCLQVTNLAFGASDRSIIADTAEVWTNSSFHDEFESVVG